MSKSLYAAQPDVAARWHPTKNNNLSPKDVTPGSGKKVWWQCEKGHEWEAVIYSVTASKTNGCPYCNSKKLLTGFNDLATVNPELAKQWHHKLNSDSLPSMFMPGSGKKVWWQCDKGHEWEAKITDRNRGGGCPYCNRSKVLTGFNDLSTSNPLIAKQWHSTKNADLKPENVLAGTSRKIWWRCDKGHEWETKCSDRNFGYGCPSCSTHVSKAEEDVAIYVAFLLPKIQIKLNDRSIASPYELDIYIPDKKIAIEFNGLYWHSEKKGKDKTYHYNKWLACKEKNIQLIQIWEDDYKRNPELIKNMLAHKLGVSQQEKVYARKTVAKILNKKQADDFLNKNHIQGSVDARLRYGLFYNDELVSVILLKTESKTKGETLNLLRYATSKNVVGGFTKLMKHVEKENPNAKDIITFSDNNVSNGGLYLNNGFVEAGIIKPDYMYVANGVRNHKFGYRLKRFKNDPNLQWVEGYTEKELAELNKLLRVWDSGKVKYIKQIRT